MEPSADAGSVRYFHDYTARCFFAIAAAVVATQTGETLALCSACLVISYEISPPCFVRPEFYFTDTIGCSTVGSIGCSIGCSIVCSIVGSATGRLRR